MIYVLYYNEKLLESIFNRIYEINHLLDNYKDNYYVECIVLGQFTTIGGSQTTYKINDRVNFQKQYLKDVTNTYNKIDRLCRKLTLDDENENKWVKINNIRVSFKTGKYPTKSEFHYMNTIWNKIK